MRERRERPMDNLSYSLNAEEAKYIGELVIPTMPKDMRLELLSNYKNKFGTAALMNLIVEFFAVAASVESNMRESVELFLVTDCHQHPHDAEKINLPTLMGAAKGSQHAVGPFPGQCHGCAFRLGSYANQSLVTMIDAADCVADMDQFNCHINTDSKGEPTNPCVGYLRSIEAIGKRLNVVTT